MRTCWVDRSGRDQQGEKLAVSYLLTEQQRVVAWVAAPCNDVELDFLAEMRVRSQGDGGKFAEASFANLEAAKVWCEERYASFGVATANPCADQVFLYSPRED